MSVGKAGYHQLFKYGAVSSYELLMRIYMLQVNLKESVPNKSSTTRFQHTEAFGDLDPSEKNALSYFMGLTISKLLAYRYLDTPWLVHLDRFKGKLTFDPGTEERPDLIGLNDKREWIIMEAKGRTNNAPRALMSKAKAQTQALKKIKGRLPVIRVACAAYATPAEILSAKWEDPEDFRENAPDLEISTEEFLEEYYAPIRNLINPNDPLIETVPFNDYSFDIKYFAGIDLKIGLLNRPNSFYVHDLDWYRKYKLELFASSIQNKALINGFVSPDGILIELGGTWDSENMSLEPTQRTVK